MRTAISLTVLLKPPQAGALKGQLLTESFLPPSKNLLFSLPPKLCIQLSVMSCRHRVYFCKKSLFLYNVSPNHILWGSMATEIILLITCWWKKQSTFGVYCAWGKISDPDLTTNLAKHFFEHESCFSRGFHDLCELFLQKNDKMLGARA